MAKIITVTIPDDGSPVEVDLAGYAGKGCSAVQDVFGRALGVTVERKKKPEYNKPCVTTNTVKH